MYEWSWEVEHHLSIDQNRIYTLHRLYHAWQLCIWWAVASKQIPMCKSTDKNSLQLILLHYHAHLRGEEPHHDEKAEIAHALEKGHLIAGEAHQRGRYVGGDSR